jgi:hypothetical protein
MPIPEHEGRQLEMHTPLTRRQGCLRGAWNGLIAVLLLGAFFPQVSQQAMARPQSRNDSHEEEEPGDGPSQSWHEQPDATSVQGAGVRMGEVKRQRLRIGVEITPQGSPCRGILATLPIPMDWPEQSVRIVDEEISDNVDRVDYRTLDESVHQMIVRIDALEASDTARAILIFEIDRHAMLEPADPQSLQLPEKPSRQLRGYLGASPFIESRHFKIRQIARELKDPEKSAWDQIEAIYDYVREHVEYKKGNIKGAVAALRDGSGDCEEMTSLFVAICRAQNIPARTVWVTDHCYPEFYLVDAQQQGHWIPCQAAGTRAFGSMPEMRPILQKGDNILIPEKKSRERYASEFLKVAALRGRDPRVRFIREFVAVE